MAITITDLAKERISSTMPTPKSYLKIGLRGGGCSGFSYDFEFIEEVDIPAASKQFEFGDVKVCIDMKSYLFLIGMEIDYEETMFKSGIKLNVPSVTASCGCGESVAF